MLKCLASAEVSRGHFGTSTEVSRIFTVVPKSTMDTSGQDYCIDTLQFFSEYPVMGVHPLLLEWHGSVMTIGDVR